MSSNGLTDAPQPVDGDLLIKAERRKHRYTLSMVPGEPQLAHRSRQTLLQLARRFAERHGVDTWFADGRTFVRLGDHRRLATAGAPPAAHVAMLEAKAAWPATA